MTLLPITPPHLGMANANATIFHLEIAPKLLFVLLPPKCRRSHINPLLLSLPLFASSQSPGTPSASTPTSTEMNSQDSPFLGPTQAVHSNDSSWAFLPDGRVIITLKLEMAKSKPSSSCVLPLPPTVLFSML